MACKLQDKCDNGKICKYANNESYQMLGGSCYHAKEPKTNEEHIRYCSTEELVEEILAWWFNGANTYSEFGLYSHEIEEAKTRIEEWLGEKHE